jgi:hypothetical protein
MRKLSFAAALLLVAACGSIGLPDLGGILGSPSSDQPSDVSGTVQNVDNANQRIDLNVNTINLRTTSTTGSIYWDSGTRVEYQGQVYSPADLERGDQISVRGSTDNGRYIADVITVTRNVRG